MFLYGLRLRACLRLFFMFMIFLHFQEKPEVVDMMLSKLAEYSKGMVPALHPAQDINDANPSKHGGSWEPWV